MMDAVDERKAKRRLQNRLAQQRFREKLKSGRSKVEGDDVSPVSSDSASGSDRTLSGASTIEASKSGQVTTRSASEESMTIVNQEHSQAEALHALLRTLLYPSPCAGVAQLFMPQFHFAHALYGNAARMGVSKAQIRDYWCISTIGKAWAAKVRTKDDISDKERFSVLFPTLVQQKQEQKTITCAPVKEEEEVRHWQFDRIPANMQPTDLQRTVEHHPYIDVAYPWPVMRDRILLLMDVAFDEDELCHWTLHAQERVGEPAFTIWGDDLMDESAYELSESFVKTWWFLLDQSIVRRTNWWRRQRGMAPIVHEWIL